MSCTDVMVVAVPTANKDAYRAYARAANAVFLEHGAVSAVDHWGDEAPVGKVTDFPKAVQASADETVVLGWLTWPDKAARDIGWEKAMQDPRSAALQMPFDGSRMIYGASRRCRGLSRGCSAPDDRADSLSKENSTTWYF